MADTKITKSRNWWGVLYPENMVDGWQDKIYRTLQVPFEYIIHDKDSVEFEEDEKQPRKIHVHLVVHFNSPTTYKHIFNLFNCLSVDGKRCLNKVEAIIHLKYAHSYLTHRTPECIKKDKYLYDPGSVISGNNWDLGAFVDIDESDKLFLYRFLRDSCEKYDIRSCYMLERSVENGFLDPGIDVSSNDIVLYIKNNRRAFESICKEVNFEHSKKNKKN